jgi:hypothetical protein
MHRRIPGLLLCLAPLVLRADADWKALAARYPQAMSVVEDDRETYEVAADGKYVATMHYRATILKEPGIAQLSRYDESYFEKYDQVSVKRAVVVGPDGRTIPVDPDNIKDMPMPANGPFYLQGVRLLVISFPQLQVGSTVEVEMETHRNAPPMDGAFSLLDPLQTEMPVLQQSVRVTLPSAMPLAWKLYRGEAKFTSGGQDDRNTYEWQIPEQAQIIPEPSMPPASEVTPVLAVSTIPDWKHVSRWYAGLCKDGQKMTPELEKLVHDVIAGKHDQEDQIRALYYWVAKNIRYVETSYSGEKAGFKPATAEQTFQRKYGVCRDKAQFLTTLLRDIGVDAYPTLITSGVRQDVDIPGIQFNHAIVAIRRADGTFTFLDPTAEDSREYLPYSDQDKFALVCTPEGEDIQSTAIAPPAENRMDISLETTLGAKGEVSTKVVMNPSGYDELAFRSYLNSMAPASREMLFKSVAGKLLPGASLTEFSLSNLDDLNTPVRMAFTMSAPGQGIQAGDYLVFTTPGQGGRLDLILGSLLEGASSGQRRYPLELESTADSRIRDTIHLPRGYIPRSLPDPLKAKANGVSLSSRFEAAGGGLVYAEDFTVSKLYFSGADYQALRGLLQQRGRLRDGKVILVRAGGAK